MTANVSAATVGHHEGAPHGHSSHSGHSAHVHHWETSIAPMCAVFGIFFALPLGFSFFFVYNNILLTMVALGIGIPLLLFGIAKWISEGLTQKPLVEGLAGVAMPIFIVSEIFIFLSFFASYWMVRLGSYAWPPEHTPDMPVGLPLFMTFLLVTSSVTIHKAEEMFEHGDMAAFRKWMVITLLFGLAFLSCTTFEYHHLLEHGFTPATNAFSMIFFSITGFHASHVVIGLSIFLAILIPALKGRTNKTFLLCGSIYWHFVDVVWIFVVSQIYFW